MKIDGTIGKRPLLWLNAMCLDAPLVALAWQAIIARDVHVEVALTPRVLLFSTAWLIYLADRFADSFRPHAIGPCSSRQRFCREHRVWFGGMMLLLGCANGIAVFRYLDRATFIAGVVIGTVIGVYLGVNLFADRLWRAIPVKEVTIGFLFALGTIAAIHVRNAAFVMVALSFASLCACNCLLISVWERELDVAQEKSSFATTVPQLFWLPAALTLMVAAGAIGTVFVFGPLRSLICVAISAVLLALLARFERIPCDQRVALADLVLLTPVLFLGA